ncbi:anaerobic sulfatase maturase [Aureibacter tunicatorum]|uniref:Radical SAM core domain-containing protein n=1 Tax=Aureibacter tunicatorum TaxID=866807 RepID=A0AAE4BUG7_9BACT|nr:anaerobic sulfatase maturase [Aureibacter tunicatorum]MDR6241766.1 uncharacterized protein [Aureibacter tunicatorum]BDD07373.1 anaerobic sulfatase-maturating enzyme [Aureibacter tunicatorum]
MSTLNFLETEERINKKKHFNVLAKTIGPVCNLDCDYCYYLEKENIYAENKKAVQFKMPESTLELYIKKYLEDQPAEAKEVLFTWHGGEPTLMGLAYYERIVELQNKHNKASKKISNSLQTNGVLINDNWARFFAKENWLIGLSIDGPEDLHNAYRPNKGGKGSFSKVMNAVNLFKKHEVRFNTLTVIHDKNVKHPKRVYEFLKGIGSSFLQFLPVQEQIAEDENETLPLVHQKYKKKTYITKESVAPVDYGNFLIGVFDLWLERDVGSVFVQHFDLALEAWCGYNPNMCVFAKHCGDALAIEHNGDVYSCDHFVYPEYKLGNVNDSSFQSLLKLPAQERFGYDKYNSLPLQCRECEFRFACNGECPKNRFGVVKNGEKVAYLCEAYRMYFTHISPYMEVMKKLLDMQRPPADIMDLIAKRKKEEKRKKKIEKKLKRLSNR